MSIKIEYLAPERIKVGKKPITIVLGVAEGLDDLTPDELRSYNDYIISRNREDEPALRVIHWNYDTDDREYGTVIDETIISYLVVPDYNLDMNVRWKKIDCDIIK